MTAVHSGVIINSEAKRALGTCLRFGRAGALGHLTWHSFLEPSLMTLGLSALVSWLSQSYESLCFFFSHESGLL